MIIDRSEVWVTGVGIISSLGTGFKENIYNIKSGQSPLKILQGLNSIHDGKYIVGQIPLTDLELIQKHHLDYDENLNRTSIMASIAFEECLTSANAKSFVSSITIACATTVGGMSSTESKFDEIIRKEYTPDAVFIDEMDCGNMGRMLQNQYDTGGENFTISTACSSASNSIVLGGRLIRSGKSKMVIAGGSDSLSKFVLNGFLSLKNVDKEACRPFDASRSGLNLGEGAAFLLLEESEHARSRNAKPLAILKGYCNVNETYHMTGSSPDGDGALLAMKGAVENSGLTPEDIDFVHAHGTSTIDNDLAESVALNKLFGREISFASSKCYTGHTLAASGAISSVLSIGMLDEDFIYPALNFNEPIPESGLTPNINFMSDTGLKNVMINSFGFGGNNTSLIFSKAE